MRWRLFFTPAVRKSPTSRPIEVLPLRSFRAKPANCYLIVHCLIPRAFPNPPINTCPETMGIIWSAKYGPLFNVEVSIRLCVFLMIKRAVSPGAAQSRWSKLWRKLLEGFIFRLQAYAAQIRLSVFASLPPVLSLLRGIYVETFNILKSISPFSPHDRLTYAY